MKGAGTRGRGHVSTTRNAWHVFDHEAMPTEQYPRKEDWLFPIRPDTFKTTMNVPGMHSRDERKKPS